MQTDPDAALWPLRVEALQLSLDECDTPAALAERLGHISIQRIRRRAEARGRDDERAVEEIIGAAMQRVGLSPTP
jgi:hypothetical protein